MNLPEPSPKGRTLSDAMRSIVWRDPRPRRKTIASQYEPKGEGGHRVEKRPARNAPCPCGSGLKFKKCCNGRTS